MIFEIFLEGIRLDVIFSYIVWLIYNPLIGNVKLESIMARCILLLGLFYTVRHKKLHHFVFVFCNNFIISFFI